MVKIEVPIFRSSRVHDLVQFDQLEHKILKGETMSYSTLYLQDLLASSTEHTYVFSAVNSDDKRQ